VLLSLAKQLSSPFWNSEAAAQIWRVLIVDDNADSADSTVSCCECQA